MRVAVLCSSSSCAALCGRFRWRVAMRLYQKRAESAAGWRPVLTGKTLANGHIYGASYPRRSRVVFFLIGAAARRSGHARALGVVVVVVVDLLRAVLADLHARFFVRSAPVGESATARNATSRGVSDRSPSTRVDAAATRAASIGLSAVLLLAVILVRRTRCSLIVVRQRV